MPCQDTPSISETSRTTAAEPHSVGYAKHSIDACRPKESVESESTPSEADSVQALGGRMWEELQNPEDPERPAWRGSTAAETQSVSYAKHSSSALAALGLKVWEEQYANDPGSREEVIFLGVEEADDTSIDSATLIAMMTGVWNYIF